MKYRKRPVVIEAFRWSEKTAPDEKPAWAVDAVRKGTIFFVNDCTPDRKMKIKTLEGIMTANPGDFIIRGVNGELYPCKPDIFAKTYELVE